MPHPLKSICLVAIHSLVPEEAETIAAAVRAFGADCRIALTAEALREIVVETPVNGLLLSIPSTIRIDAAGKALLRTLEQVYPTARAKVKPSDRSLSVMGMRGPVTRTLPDFLVVCAAFPARRIRRYERVAKTLNALAAAGAGEPEQTFSLDLSGGGTLLHTALERSVGDVLSLSFLELPWDAPVHAEVRHVFPWGMPFHARSVGLRFLDMAPDHLANLRRMLYDGKG